MMYKKASVLGLVFLGFFLSSVINYGYGEEYTQSDMGKVTIRFCNQTGEEKHDDVIYVEPGKEQKLRLCVNNRGEKQMAFEYGFTKGEYTEGGVRVCDADMSTGNRFSMLIPEIQGRSILIDPMSNKTIEEQIVIPPGMSGLQMGCLVYKLAVPKSVGGMFVLEVRQYGAIDIVVGGETMVKSKIEVLDITGGVFSTNKKIKAQVDKDNNLTLKFMVENQGNIGQNISVTGKVYNMLGFQRDFSIDAKQVAPGGKNEFVANVGILPIYKGLLSITFNIKNDPQFLFPISNEKLKQTGYFSGNGNILIFSRILIVVLILVLLIIYKLFVPKRRKISIEQVQTMTPPIV